MKLVRSIFPVGGLAMRETSVRSALWKCPLAAAVGINQQELNRTGTASIADRGNLERQHKSRIPGCPHSRPAFSFQDTLTIFHQYESATKKVQVRVTKGVTSGLLRLGLPEVAAVGCRRDGKAGACNILFMSASKGE